jgi:peroxiredoxin
MVNQSTRDKVSKLAPDFELLDLEGNPHSLSDYRGRSLLLIFLRHTG